MKLGRLTRYSSDTKYLTAGELKILGLDESCAQQFISAIRKLNRDWTGSPSIEPFIALSLKHSWG